MPPRAAQGQSRPGPRGLGIGAVFNGQVRGLWTYLTKVSQGRGLRLTRRQAQYDEVTAAALKALNDGMAELGLSLHRLGADAHHRDAIYWQRKMENQWRHNAKIGVVFPPWMFPWIAAHLFGKQAAGDQRTRAQVRVSARADDKRDLAQIKRQVDAMHQLIEREAASGWRAGYPDRTSVIQKALAYLITRDPAVRDLAGLVARGVIDFAAVDDPLARYLLSKLLTRLISHLGADRAAGGLLDGLLAPLVGNPRPQGLHDVIQAIGQDIAAGQAQWQQFFEQGGAQVEQAGSEWRDITSIGGELALIAFFGLAVTEPEAWARDITDTIGTVAADTITGVADLIKGA